MSKILGLDVSTFGQLSLDSDLYSLLSIHYLAHVRCFAIRSDLFFCVTRNEIIVLYVGCC